MKTIKSIACLLLSLLMVLSVVACGNTETPSDASTPADNSVVDNTDVSSEDEVTSVESTDTNTSSASKPTGGTTSLTWKEVKATLPKNASGKTVEIMEWNAQTPMNKKVCDAFTKETGIKVTYTVEGFSSYMAKIASRVATGNPPTVARLRDNVPEYMSAMQPIQKTSYNFNDTYWDKDLLDAYTFNGRTYGVGLKNTPYYQPVVTFYNQEIIDKYDLDDPYELWKAGKWTWEAMLGICEDVIDESNGKVWGATLLFGEYVYSTGNTYVDFKNGKFVNTVNSQGVIKALQEQNKWHKEGLITDGTCLRDDFNLGKGLFLFDAEIGARMGHYYFRELKNKDIIKCVPVPSVKGQKDYYVCISELEAYGIVNKCANVELAPYFLRYYLDASNYDMKNFYSDESFLEVVNWTRNYKGIPTYFTLSGSNVAGSTWSCEASQINNKIASSHVPAIKSNVDAANAQLTKLVK